MVKKPKKKKLGRLIVSCKRVRPNNWNDNDMTAQDFKKLKLSIREDGFIEPLTVRYILRKDLYEIIGGEHRWKAVQELHKEGITIYGNPAKDNILKKGKIVIENLGLVTDVIAKKISIKLNSLRGTPNEERRALIVKDLLTENVSMRSMPFSEADINHFSEILDFDWEAMVTPEVPLSDNEPPGEAIKEPEESAVDLLDSILTPQNFPVAQAQEFYKRYVKMLKAKKIPRVDGWQGLFTLLEAWESKKKTKTKNKN